MIRFDANAVQVIVSRNIFYAPDNGSLKPYVEIYWQINPRSILFSKVNGFFQGKIRTDIIISNHNGAVREEHYILATQPVEDGAGLYAQNILDLRRYEVPPGKYLLKIRFTDELKNTSQYTFTDSFQVAVVNAPTLSDIQLVDTIIASDEQNIFSRNGHLQIPFCSNFFDESRKQLHYYAEIYQREQDTTTGFVYKSFVSKKEWDAPLNNLLKTDTLKSTTVNIAEGKFPLKTLSSGNYYLNIIVDNFAGERIAAKSLFFQVMNPNPESTAEGIISDTTGNNPVEITSVFNLSKTFLAKYNPSQVRAILKMLIPIADPNERTTINSFLKHPEDIYSRYFIYNFWVRRNKLKPEAAWKEYAEKVKEVNKLFGSSLLTGYESERGITYLKYGAPTERIIVNNETNAYPYEIWQYNTLPNASDALFLFYRPGLVANDYRLLHATVQGEIKNRNWRQMLYIGSIDAASSRAEQHIGNR